MYMAVNGPLEPAEGVAAEVDEEFGAGAVAGATGCAADGAGAAGAAELGAGGWLSTKVKLVPGGRTTRWPVATAVTLGGAFT